MAVTDPSGPAGPAAAEDPLPAVDTATNRIYRFLRVLVHGINRLAFRTTVEGRDLVPAEGPVIIAPVHRESADREALRRAQRVLDAGEVLVQFPEGERRTGPVVEGLHEGVAFLAARTGATVVPVGIGGSASVMPKGTRVPRPRHIHLEVGTPLPPPGRSGSGRVPRSRIHLLTEQLTAALQVLYDSSVERTGRY